MLSSQASLAYPILLSACFMPSYAFARMALDPEALLKRMEATYAEVKDYQADIEDRTYNPDGSFKTKRFLYTFILQNLRTNIGFLDSFFQLDG